MHETPASSLAGASQAPVYSARGIGKRFAGQIALSGVDLDVGAGRIVGLVGANGAGKSTLVKILSGVLAPDEGEMTLAGRPVRMRSMLEAWHAGIALVSQELNLFPALSIAENLMLVPGTGDGAVATRRAAARDMLARLGLSVDLDAPLRRLSLADRQLVELARALLQRPRVLILDEPTSALHASETDRLHAVLHELRGSGVGIIYVSHFLQELLDVVDDVTVLRDGRRVLSLDAPQRAHMPRIVGAMLGERGDSLHDKRPPPPRLASDRGAPLELRDLQGTLGLQVPSLRAERGEVVGLAGLAGAGVEELFAILFGRLAPVSGQIALPSGRPWRADTSAVVRAGVAYAPADRKRLGLTLAQSVGDNVAAVRSLSLGRSGPILDRAALHDRAEALCRRLGVKFTTAYQPVGTLSGGNQQKVVFARWIEAGPTLLLLDDPMRGVDVGARAELHVLIRELAAEGRVVLLHTSDPAEFVTVADRVLVFVNGRIDCELQGAAVTEHAVLQAMNAEAASAKAA